MSEVERVPSPSRWTRYYLKYVPPYAGHGMRAVLIFQRVDTGASFEDAEFRVWCEELIQDVRWWCVEAAPEDPFVLRLFFPAALYEGMAPYCDVAVPRRQAKGSIWRLRGPHNAQDELFRLEAVRDVNDAELADEEKLMAQP